MEKASGNQSFDSIPLQKQDEINNQGRVNLSLVKDQPSLADEKVQSLALNQRHQLKIMDSLLILKEDKKSLKKGILQTKVHSLDRNDQQHILQSSSLPASSLQEERKMVFSVETFQTEFFKKQKLLKSKAIKIGINENQTQNDENIFQEILIENSLVNVYALKRLINLTSKNLISLVIRSCLFYDNDKCILKENTKTIKQISDKDEIVRFSNKNEEQIINRNNNKLLREINFTFRVRSLSLPQIESIIIQLISTLRNPNNEIMELNQPSQQIPQKQARQRKRSSTQLNQHYQKKHQVTADMLVTEYGCHQESPFANFELKTRPLLEEKYEKYKEEDEIVNYLVHGDRQGNDQVEKCINDNIINDMSEHVNIFNKYIKGSFINDKILLIRGYSLEDPIALNMINNMIVKHRKNIKTIIFKETGTIPHESFVKISDGLIAINCLESIAFFDAQPDQKSYKLLRDIIIRESVHLGCLCKTKKNLLITLNRSSFDIEEYKLQVLGVRSKNEIEDLRYAPITTIPKHYGFYILDDQDIYEFTPYEFCIEELLFPGKKLGDQQQRDVIQKYEIGKLINIQNSYPEQVKLEIQNYQDKSIITYSGICEKIMLKHSTSLTNQSNQQELEQDIRELIKHFSYFNIVFAKRMIQNISDPILRSHLEKDCSEITYDESRVLIQGQPYLDNLILQQQELLLCNDISGYLIDNQFISNQYLINKSKRKRAFSKEEPQKISSKDFHTLNLKQLFKKEIDNPLTRGISLSFESQIFTLSKTIIEEKNIIGKEILKCFNSVSASITFYRSETFQNYLKEIVLYCKEKDLKLEIIYYINSDSFSQVFPSHTYQTEEMKGVRISKLMICQDPKPLQFSQIAPHFEIEYLYLSEMCINRTSFEGECNFGYKKIEIHRCAIEYFEHSCFKDLNEIILGYHNTNITSAFIIKLLESEQLIQSEIQQHASSTQEHLLIQMSFINDNDRQEAGPICLNKDLVSRIVKHDGRMKFLINQISGETLQYFQEHMKQRTPTELNLSMLGKLLGISMISQIGASSFENKNTTGDSDNIKNSDENQQLKQQNMKNSVFQNNSSEIAKECEAARALYMQNHQLDIHIKRDQEKKDEFLKHIPKCCSDLLKGEESSHLTQNNHINFNLTSILKDHKSEFCLFKSSIIQQPFSLKKVKVKFFCNLLLSQPLIYDYSELDNIEELDFERSFYSICDIIQIKFIDALIQLCSKLKILKLNFFFIDQTIENIPYHFTPIKHQFLKELDLSGCYFKQICPLLEALMQSASLEVLKIRISITGKDNVETEQQKIDFETITKFFLSQNVSSLRVLHLGQFTQEILGAIQKCENLEELVGNCDLNQINLVNELMKIPSLKEITAISDKYLITQQNLESFLEASQKEQSHLQRINLIYQIKYYTFSRRVTNSNNNFKFQIIKIPSMLQIVIPGEKYSVGNVNISNYKFTSSNDGGNLQQIDDFMSIVANSEIKPALSSLKELHLDHTFKFNNYEFLNYIFRENKESLTVIAFKNQNELKNNSFIGVDFSSLPKTIQLLDFSENSNLTTLKFLDPLYENIHQYSNLVLDISRTGINYSEVHKYTQHLKEVIFNQSFMEIYQLIRYYCRDDNAQQLAMGDLFQKILNTEREKPEVKVFYQLLLQEKISPSNILKNNKLFVMSELNVIQSQADFNNNELMKVYYKQKEDPRFSKNRNLGNKFLLFCAILLKQTHSSILGYSKTYHNPYFYIQKRLGMLEETNKMHLSNNEHLFFDYLLLLEMQSKQKLKQVYLPLNLEVSYSNALHNAKLKLNINEIKMIENLYRIPPSEIVLENMSIQFIKAWYVINSLSPLTIKTTIQNFDEHQIYNSSIGNFLTQNLKRSSFLKNLLSGTPHKYRYDETVQLLAQHLDNQIKEKQSLYLLSLFPLYIFICIFGVIYFSIYFNVICGNGISWYSYYMYLLYGTITLFIELFIFKKCLNFISHLVPSLEIDLNPGCLISIINSIKQFMIDSTWINQWYVGYSYSFIQSQLARFDNFTNIAFLYSTYQCENYSIFYISLCFISIPFLHALFEFLHVMLLPRKQYQLPTASLDTYYRICNVIEFKAVADILDLVSPSNVTSIGGRMYNSRIVSSFIRIIGESMPLVVIQIYNLSQNPITSSLVLSLFLSILTFITLLINLLTITPSTLNQEDFNKLNEKKKRDKVVENYESRLQTYEDETFALCFYNHLKQIRPKYLQQREHMNTALTNKDQDIQRYFDQLFDSPKQSQKE